MAMEKTQGLKGRDGAIRRHENGPIRYVVWDWNGTLFDDASLCMDIINGLLRKHGGRELKMEQYREVFGFPVRDYYVRLGFDFEKDSWERLSKEFIGKYEARRYECLLRDGALEALTACKKAGMAQSILSAYNHRTLEGIVDHFGLRNFFEYLSGLENHYADSKLANGKRLLSLLRIPPDRVLFVGDTEHDWEVSNALGTRCVLLTGGHHSERKLRACGVPVVHSLQEIDGSLLARI
ncbi:MAG: HAD hydrolase-like protein [Chitinivibrionales bacterium]|nr:HAD hydrolase-like protein [Chitinivibrionales bacterium]MBD3357972.1 HAD hydrolase-like protein [Chitinivibrionales bacterium]